MRDTLFPYANFRGFSIVQLAGIMREMKKVTRTDRFCLTELVGERYFASSPQAVVVARRLPAQPVVEGLWTAGSTWGWPVDFL